MNEETYYKAMQSRDHRFDGKFFICVKTTGIYCRPICPAKPKPENVEFFTNANDAENAGYRPCMRCRPECAPSSPAWHGKSAVVQRALKVINNEGYVDLSDEEFAAKFGLTARHLRRLFNDEIGKTPKQLADIHRLDFSRRLISESSLPITTIAMNSGFSSVRRFNDAFKKRFHENPSYFRKNHTNLQREGIVFSLSYRPPFRWSEHLSFYAHHAIYGLEAVSDQYYERVFKRDDSLGHIKVAHNAPNSTLDVQITLADQSHLLWVVQNVRRMFDLDSDPMVMAHHFNTSTFLSQLWKNYPGLRISGSWDPFEASICTILGQLVSLKHARMLVSQLVKNYGEDAKHPITGETIKLFPTAQALARANLDALKTTGRRKQTIRDFSRLIDSKALELSAHQDPLHLQKQLLTIPGIGPWTAEYIRLRALTDTDAFPAKDLIINRIVEQHPDLCTDDFRPWRAYLAIYLWKHHELTPTKKQATKKVRKS